MEMSMSTHNFYERIAAERKDDEPLRQCVRETVRKMQEQETSLNKPGVLLGKIQSGKTRAFIGVIALAFDHGYDVAVVLTKGTVSLARQTLKRIKSDFAPFMEHDAVQVFDIMSLPRLTRHELNQKLILIAKKEDDNMNRLLESITTLYPSLTEKRLLIIDDEADLASVTAQKKGSDVKRGKVSEQIDQLRDLVKASVYLQVTATPYSLYLQPEEDRVTANGLFRPKRPAFTVILPTHGAYVGGDYYFEKSSDPASPAYYFYRQVPSAERDALRKEDRRRFKIESIMTEKGILVLREAIMNFVVGGCIRRLQQTASEQFPQKYSFLFHTEQSRASHDWQEEVVVTVKAALEEMAVSSNAALDALIHSAYGDLKRSIELGDVPMPNYNQVEAAVRKALIDEELMITKVNSDKDVEELLDDEGQLKLRTPLNLFIGGQILDRGITIKNLIGFYYGRNPGRYQQDTVLQHARMYGSRPFADLPVTRFYAPLAVYQVMRRIHEFDAALRQAFINGEHDKGVYFIQRDAGNTLIPCSPNKLLFSELTTVRPGKRYLPVGFQTVAKTNGKKSLERLDWAVEEACGGRYHKPVLISVQTALKLVEASYENLEFEDEDDNDQRANLAILEHLSNNSVNPHERGEVWLVAATGRDLSRVRKDGRFENSPDTQQQTAIAEEHAQNIPVLLMMRQNGTEEKGWRDLPFWWPVIVSPINAVTSVFSAETRRENGEATKVRTASI